MQRTEHDFPPQPGNAGLGEIAYETLRKAIITHELRPNEKISEGSLVERFGLSRSATRVAISRLSAKQLVSSRSSKTQVIAPLSLGQVTQIFQARNLLEPEAARLAAGHVNVQDLLESNAACLRPYRPGNKAEEFAFLEANQAFHLYVASASGNPHLCQFIEQLHDHTMRILWLSLQIENRPGVWHAGHEEIIEALAAGDGDRASQMALDHLQAGQILIYEILSTSEALSQQALS